MCLLENKAIILPFFIIWYLVDRNQKVQQERLNKTRKPICGMGVYKFTVVGSKIGVKNSEEMENEKRLWSSLYIENLKMREIEGRIWRKLLLGDVFIQGVSFLNFVSRDIVFF